MCNNEVDVMFMKPYKKDSNLYYVDENDRSSGLKTQIKALLPQPKIIVKGNESMNFFIIIRGSLLAIISVFIMTSGEFLEMSELFDVQHLLMRSDSMSAEMMCQLYEGQLYKYTNVMKGWQFRWFILDPKTGILNYYLSEGESRQAPRGWIHLESAVISPSDEDSNTFTVNSSTGEQFKLRAQDARARQEWVNRLRAVAQLHAAAVAHNNPPIQPREHVTPGNGGSSVWDAFAAVKDHLFRAEQSNFLLARAIDDLPNCGDVCHVDQDLLLLKAASHAMLLSLSQCLYILQHQQSTSEGISNFKNSKGNSDHANCSSSHSKKKFVL